MPKPKVQIVQDSRETLPLTFPSREVEVVVESVDAGDYAIKINGELQPVRVERKGNDVWSSFHGDAYRREKDKMRRAKELGARYIILIEMPYYKVRNGYEYSKKDGLTQLRQLESISLRYGVELRYASDRREAGFMCQEILLAYVRAWEKEERSKGGTFNQVSKHRYQKHQGGQTL